MQATKQFTVTKGCEPGKFNLQQTYFCNEGERKLKKNKFIVTFCAAEVSLSFVGYSYHDIIK